jgi:hypothetical protein
MIMEMIDYAKHYWNDHKKTVVVVGIILVIAIIL